MNEQDTLGLLALLSQRMGERQDYRTNIDKVMEWMGANFPPQTVGLLKQLLLSSKGRQLGRAMQLFDVPDQGPMPVEVPRQVNPSMLYPPVMQNPLTPIPGSKRPLGDIQGLVPAYGIWYRQGEDGSFSAVRPEEYPKEQPEKYTPADNEA